MKKFKKDNLQIRIFDSRAEMGEEAARDVAEYIARVLNEKEVLNIVFAAAPSQNEFLAALLRKDIDWTRINAFHMDEYVGLSPQAPQCFGNFLKINIFEKVPFKSVHYFDGTANDPQEMCRQYAALLSRYPVDIVFMGIGENGHIAFNDPHVALFNDPEMVKVVELDDTCRNQQVNDGCFTRVEEVPQRAYTLTIPALMAAGRIFCIVPASTKACAVRDTVTGEVTERCPASILRRHKEATLYCDKDSAAYLIKIPETQEV